METILTVLATIITIWLALGILTRWWFVRLGMKKGEAIPNRLQDTIATIIFWPCFLSVLIGLTFIERMFDGHSR